MAVVPGSASKADQTNKTQDSFLPVISRAFNQNQRFLPTRYWAIITHMSNKSLAATNTYLNKGETAKKMRVRSLASSTAIETRQPISQIEQKLTRSKRPSQRRVELA